MRCGILSILLGSIFSSCTYIPLSSDAQWDLLHQAKTSVLEKESSSESDHFSYQSLRDKKVQAYVASIGTKLTQATQVESVDFHVLETSYIQGFTDYSDIYVTQGMLNSISNEAELASLLAHEIAHIALKHDEAHFKDQGKLWDILTHETETQAGTRLGLDEHRYDIAYSNFNKKKEEEADEFGAELVAKTGYNPYVFCGLFERLAKNSKDRIFVQIGNLKGSHKSLTNRAEHLRKYLAKKGYLDNKKGFFTGQYHTGLRSLIASQKHFTSEQGEILNEITRYQNELDRSQKIGKVISVKRFTHIVGRILDLAEAHNLSKESLLFDSKSYKNFMQERLIQRFPFWGDFESNLNAKLGILVALISRFDIALSGTSLMAADSLVGTIFSAPAAFVGSAAAIGYALHKATHSHEDGEGGDSTGQNIFSVGQYPTADHWDKMLGGTKGDFHKKIKGDIISDHAEDLRTNGIGKNPDIGYDKKTKKITFKDRITGKEYQSDTPVDNYKDE